MTATIHVNMAYVADVLDEARILIDRLHGLQVPVTGDSVSARKAAAVERAQVKTDLSYLSHLLDKARVLSDDMHQRITRSAKEAERKAS